MSRISRSFVVAVVCWAILAMDSKASPPTCTVHFFDWYVVSDQSPLSEIQKRWTYDVDWESLGIRPADIGNTVHYYEVQCRKIREAGFDGIHYEWHGNPVKPPFREALSKTNVPVAMFYDMEIRFHAQDQFITPTAEFADTFVEDVASFYASVPKPLWLHDRHGRLPIIVYGYRFDSRVTDPDAWGRFYRAIISGVEQKLGEQVVFHWTNNGSPQQMYGFQHFPEIQSYIFNEANRQTPVNAHAVTFVVHYDDLGVSFARGGPRASRWIRNDIRYLQESLWLARHTDPDLVFNYGWNELYEGEHLLPDSLWGHWRYEVAAAIVKDIKTHAKADLPRALIIVDDILPRYHGATAEQIAVLQREWQLLSRLRSLVPQADVVLSGSEYKLDDYALVFALNTVKHTTEEKTLAACTTAVVYTNPEAGQQTAMTRRFTAHPAQPLSRANPGPENEYVLITRPIDVDLDRFPLLQFRCRNSSGTIFHIRYWGKTAEGRELEVWQESSETDDRQSSGRWLEGEVDIAKIAHQVAGEPIKRLTRFEVILDDLEPNGQFSLDVDYLRMENKSGEVGWEEQFQSTDNWSVHASFEGFPDAQGRFAFSVREENGATLGRLDLQAVVSALLPGSLDRTTQLIDPLESVRVMAVEEFEGTTVPVLLARDHACWMNTYTPTDDCWKTIFEDILGQELHRGVMFGSYSWSVSRDGVTAKTETTATAIQQEALPVSRIRFVAPPELDRPLVHTLPLGYETMQLRVVAGQRDKISFPDPDSQPPGITLLPGEVVELIR